MKWNDNPTVKRWVIIGAAFVLALVFVGCLTRDPAGAVTPPAPPAPVTFSAQAQDVFVALSGGPCHAWRWTPDWPTYNSFGNKATDSALDLQWGVGCKYRNITSVEHYWCSDLGGTWDFNGCSKSHGNTGSYTMSGTATWRYTYTYLGIKFHASPYVTFTVNANGGVNGTFYYDN